MENITEAQKKLLKKLRSKDPGLVVRWSEDRGVASLLKGKLFSWQADDKPEDLLKKWMREFGLLIGPKDVLENIEYVGTTKTKTKQVRIKAMQKAQGLPIYGATLLLFADKKHGILRVQSGFYRDVIVPEARLGTRRINFAAREENLVERLRKRLESDPEGLKFAKSVRKKRGLGLRGRDDTNFPLVEPPKMWLYPTKQGLRQAFRVLAYQPILWSDISGTSRKTVDAVNMVIDARTGRIIEEGARLGMAYTDVTGDGLATLVDGTGSYITRNLLIVQEDNQDYLLFNRTHNPDIITHNAGGSDAGIENMFQNDNDISRDADSHWNTTTTSCNTATRENSQQPETDGHFFAEQAFNFYDNLGWQGFDNGVWGTHCPIRVAAHIGADANAYFWRYILNGKHYGYIAFYDGECSGGNIDYDFMAGDPAIFAHEYQHGITYFGAQDSAGDPGYLEISGWHRAIHEGLSDLMAGLRTGLWVTPAIWPNGAARGGKPFRRIEFPRSTDNKDNVAYLDHYDDRNTTSDSYERSTILSHAAFLAGQGGVHQRTSRAAELIPVVGVGRDKIAEIIHHAVVTYFDNIPANNTAGQTMIEAARFILDAAEDNAGNDRSCEYVMLRRAFYAVGLFPYDDKYSKTVYGGEACMLPWTIAWKHSRPYLGFPALWWKSPDLFINNGNGPEYDATVGQENDLFARVRNIGDENLTNVKVKFFFRAHGTNLPPSSTQWKECKNQAGDPCVLDIPNLAAGSMNFIDENNPPANQAVKWYLDPSEIVQGLNHFCLRAEIECEADNHNNDCPNYVQSNISYTLLKLADKLDITYMVANWGKKPIPLDLEVKHTLPRGFKIEYTGRAHLKNIRLEQKEEKPLRWQITSPRRLPRLLSPPYDGKIIAKIQSTEIKGLFNGILSDSRISKRTREREMILIEGQLSGSIDEKGRVSGPFKGKLNIGNGKITGGLSCTVYQGRRRLPNVSLSLRGFLEPLRTIDFIQKINGKEVGGISIKVKPTPPRR